MPDLAAALARYGDREAIVNERGAVTASEILGRARLQAQVALEAFYVDNWSDLEDVAKGLEQTARFLPKTKDIPTKHKDKLPAGDQTQKK